MDYRQKERYRHCYVHMDGCLKHPEPVHSQTSTPTMATIVA